MFSFRSAPLRRTLAFAAVLCLASSSFGAEPPVNLQSEDSPSVARMEALIQPAETTFTGAEATEDGVKFNLDLGERRQNWTHARWSVHELESPMDLSEFQAVFLEVQTENPRRDAGVYLALREKDGAWYSHPWAVHLSAENGVNQGIARFKNFSLPHYHNPPNGRFTDANDRFDTDAITAIAIGVVNPLGIGEVSFTLRRIAGVELTETPAEPITVTSSGRLLDINNTTTVPSGLFGGFHLGSGRHEKYRLAASRSIHHDGVGGNANLGTPHTPIHINTAGDRVRPSPRLTLSDWEERSEAFGRRMGERAAEAGETLYVEYWNEPYLNWANFNRANFIPRYYDQSRAEEGGPVHIRHDGAEAPHLIWTQDRDHFQGFMIGGSARRFGNLDHWRRGRREDGRALSSSAEPYRSMENHYDGRWEPASHPPLDVPDGETYEYNGQTLTAFTPWHIVDTTQFTYWAGKGMLKMYIDPMLALGRGLKEANPDATYIVGWGNRPSEDHWAGFHQLYKPTIDAGIDVIDAYNDHDYGGDPRNLSANYEVVTAYGVLEHDKWLYAYNTETGNNTDPQVYRDQATTSANVGKFEWVSTKMMHALSQVPDKAKVFLHFGDGQNTGGGGGGWWSDNGEGVCMEMLINLRGRLLQAHSSAEDVYVVASIDGTDPYAPRPDFLPQRKEWVVAVFNDRTESRDLTLDLQAPAGAQVGEGTVKWSRIEDAAVVVEEESVATENNRFTGNITLGPRELRIYTFPIENSDDLDENPETWAGAQAPVLRRQFFGPTLLTEVQPGKPLEETLSVDPDLLARAQRAEFGFVAQRLGHGDARLTLNEEATHILPGVIPPENNAHVTRISLDPAHLRAENEIRIDIPNADRAGFFLGMYSLWIETD
ncbi:MAG: hypothetical protein JJU29_22895 [Verrucomicrobia bacterium]|nr:hypothetical protein [Verrucomicrobiota bacterium]MCH8514637.1 hypothetical protein [Kiritimatiellia bacterium]